MSTADLLLIIGSVTVSITTVITAVVAAINAVRLSRVATQVNQIEIATNSMKDALVKSEKNLSFREGGDAEKTRAEGVSNEAKTVRRTEVD